MWKVLLIAVLAFATEAIAKRQVSDKEWDEFKKKFGKSYYDLEDESRIDAYRDSMDVIEGYNKFYAEGKISFNCSVNKYSDLSLSDYGLLANSLTNDTAIKEARSYRIFDASLDNCLEHCIPKTWNWIKENPAMDVIVDQGEICGSCYSFATVAAIEAHNYIHNGGNYIKLSEQQIIDCAHRFGAKECQYGAVTSAHNYFVSDIDVMKGTPRAPRGAMAASDYEYIAEPSGYCYYQKKKAKVFVKHYMAIPPNENALMIALAQYGPVATGIDATLSSFHFYSSGIYDDPKCKSDKNSHAILVVGYGSQNGTGYWVIKNSWGRGWGENGYGRVLRNGQNFAGILNMPLFPVIDKHLTNKGPTTKHIMPLSLKNCKCGNTPYSYGTATH